MAADKWESEPESTQSRVAEAEELDEYVAIRIRTVWRVVLGACGMALVIGLTVRILVHPPVVTSLSIGALASAPSTALAIVLGRRQARRNKEGGWLATLLYGKPPASIEDRYP